MDFLNKFFEQAKVVFEQVPTGKKFAIVTVAVLVVAGVMSMAYMSGASNLQPLFSKLSSEDAQSIIDQLRTQNVQFELADGGHTVLVPPDKVYTLRLSLASQGIPSGGHVGYEIFDAGTFGMTEFVQKLNYNRALQGELTRTIGSIAEVDSARVHIVTPEKSLFVGEQKDPTASVVLKLKGGKTISDPQVQGIVHLVASSVEGLKPQNVTVVDIHGNILSGGEEGDEVVRLTNTQLEYRRKMEKNFENRIESMMEPIIGAKKVVARVSVELDFTQMEKTEEEYDPESQVARSSQTTEESSVGAQMPIGVAGVQSNLPENIGDEGAAGAGGEAVTAGAAPAAAVSQPPKSSRTSETVNYEINKVVRRVVSPTGTVKRITASVLVDGSYKTAKAEDGKETSEYVPRSPEEIAKFVTLVKNAMGYDEQRGDKIEVIDAPFDTGKFMDERLTLAEEANRELILEVVKYAGIAIGLLLFYLFVIRPMVAWLTRAEAEVEALNTLPKTLEEIEAAMGLEGTKEAEFVDYRKQAAELVKVDPTAAAETVRLWIKQRKG